MTKKLKLLSRQMAVKIAMMKSVARSAVISRMRASSIARVAEKCCGDRRGIIAGALINTCAMLISVFGDFKEEAHENVVRDLAFRLRICRLLGKL